MYPIPANATRIRYLESTGTQYVDTGAPNGEPFTIQLRFSLAASNISNDSIWGSFQDGSRRMMYIVNLSNGKKRLQISHGVSSNNTRVADLVVDAVHTISVRQAGNMQVQIDDGTPLRYSFGDDLAEQPGVTLWLFSRNGNSLPCKMRLYYATIRDADDVIVRSFVPVRVGAVGYIFDRVSGTLFGNDGTGDFVLGQDTFQQGVIPTRMMVAGVRKNDAITNP